MFSVILHGHIHNKENDNLAFLQYMYLDPGNLIIYSGVSRFCDDAISICGGPSAAGSLGAHHR